MKLHAKAKLFWGIYTIADIAMAIFDYVILLSTAQVDASDNTLLFPYSIVSKVAVLIFLLYMIYRVAILYKSAKHPRIMQILGILLLVLFVFNNIPATSGSVSTLVNAMSLILWICDIKLIFLTEKN